MYRDSINVYLHQNRFIFVDGALSRKFKLLIGMVFDASHGAAMEAGATQEEITEALRVTQYLTGVGCVYTASQALKELFG